MRSILVIQLTAAFLLAGSFTAAAQGKKTGACNQDACVKTCIDRGGQPRGCPKYCQDKINGNSACK